MLKRIVLFAVFSFSGIALADQIPMIALQADDAGVGKQCNNPGRSIFAEYRRDGFGGISDVRSWCQQYIDFYRISRDRFDDHCGWQRRGSYDNYTWDGQFVIFRNFIGNPRFQLRDYCND